MAKKSVLEQMRDAVRSGKLKSYASGGLVSHSQTISLTVADERFDGLLTPKETAAELVRHALSQEPKR